jgi:hypothetical protein
MVWEVEIRKSKPSNEETYNQESKTKKTIPMLKSKRSFVDITNNP